MRQGKMLWWSQLKGFGIAVSEGEKFYVNVLRLAGSNERLPRTGDLIEFRLGKPAKDWRLAQAIDVEIIDETTAVTALAGKAEQAEGN